ncbi:MAG: DUF2070 family protein [Peptococcaceae bacterium]|jgi:hypothetical protein|nr:DUF2070 family protein [Peptococcaceae bacterium]
MGKEYELIAFETEKGDTVYVEVVSTDEHSSEYVRSGGQPQDRIPEKATKKIEEALSLIAPIANGVLSAVQNMREQPTEIEAAFKVVLSSKADLKLVTLSSDANLEIKLSWKAK